MAKLRGAETAIVRAKFDADLSMVHSANAETMPKVFAAEEDLAHANRRVESGHGQQGK